MATEERLDPVAALQHEIRELRHLAQGEHAKFLNEKQLSARTVQQEATRRVNVRRQLRILGGLLEGASSPLDLQLDLLREHVAAAVEALGEEQPADEAEAVRKQVGSLVEDAEAVAATTGLATARGLVLQLRQVAAGG